MRPRRAARVVAPISAVLLISPTGAALASASPEPGDEGSGLRHSLKATVPFTMRNPSTVGPADVSVEDPVSLSDLATFVSNIKPRSVMDLKPLLLLCQGLLTKVLSTTRAPDETPLCRSFLRVSAAAPRSTLHRTVPCPSCGKANALCPFACEAPSQIIGHQLRTYNADNVILRAELEGLRERVHETFEKLQSTSALVEQLQNRNR